jgi:hypothetical protein
MLGDPTPADRATLDTALQATYRAAGIDEHDPRTWTRPAPLLADLAHTLTGTSDEGSGFGAVGVELAQRLRPFTEGAYASVMAGPSSTPPGGHLVTISLRDLPDEVRPVATMLVLEWIWRHVASTVDRRPRLVLVDEAWRLLQSRAGAGFLAAMARTARKLWAGLVLVTQDAADVLDSELGAVVIRNSATQILMGQAPQALDRVTAAFGLSETETAFLRTARQGHGMILGRTGSRAMFEALASPAEHALITTDPHTSADTTDDGGGQVAGYVQLDPADPAGHPVAGYADDPPTDPGIGTPPVWAQPAGWS